MRSIFLNTFEEPCNKYTRVSPWFFVGFIIFVLLIVTSCSSLTPEESEWRRGIDKENWELCYIRKVTVHAGHSHGKHKRVSPIEIKDDLSRNGCKQLLGDEWAEYHYE